MNSNIANFFNNSEFREQFIRDYNFWFILIGLSYLFLIVIFRDFSIKYFKVFLWIAIGLSAIGNIWGLIFIKSGSALGALNGPLITLLFYKLLYNLYKKIYKTPPLHPLESAYSGQQGIFTDRLLMFVFFLGSIFSTIFCSLLTGKLK